jgi:hypothetical protein
LNPQSALGDARFFAIGIAASNFAALYLNVGTAQGGTCGINAYRKIMALP